MRQVKWEDFSPSKRPDHARLRFEIDKKYQVRILDSPEVKKKMGEYFKNLYPKSYVDELLK